MISFKLIWALLCSIEICHIDSNNNSLPEIVRALFFNEAKECASNGLKVGRSKPGVSILNWSFPISSGWVRFFVRSNWVASV